MVGRVWKARGLLHAELGLSFETFLFPDDRDTFHLSHSFLHPESQRRQDGTSDRPGIDILDAASRAVTSGCHSSSGGIDGTRRGLLRVEQYLPRRTHSK